ncbi:hypothetical protein [uncultured Bifidobacterium sp.]|uniref:hypothetical protein n=1 Tax=uncultured Bifidobacterium sp. TaxID=165187 RepID=UPI00258645BB|nr:hypothetical protein [uncultured Bifidobacterium sp.]
MVDDSTIVYAGNEAGTQTELINPNEIAALSKRPNGKTPNNDNRKYLWAIFASIAVLALFAAIIFAGVQMHNHRQRQLAQERARCESAMASLNEKAKQYDALKAGDGAAAGTVSDIQVADTSTIKLLDEQLKAQAPAATSCEVPSVDQYDARIQQIRDHEEWYDAHMKSLQEAVNNVNDSKELKEVEEAKSTLDETLREAQTTLDLTRGQVADESTWSHLYELHEQAQRAEESGDLSSITSVESDITSAIESVNASRDKKIAADEQKAREEALKKAQEEPKKADEANKRADDNANKDAHKENDRH